MFEQLSRVIPTAVCVAFLFILTAPAHALDEVPAGKIKVPDRIPALAQPFLLTQVTLDEGLWSHRCDLTIHYLRDDLEPDRFLAWFHKEAGLEPKAAVYGGWESQGVAGHCLGHWLSGSSLAYAHSGDKKIRELLVYTIQELARCQAAHDSGATGYGPGYIGAIPEGKRIWSEVRRGDIRTGGFDLNGGWVPWYTMHKILAGLRDAYVWADIEQAREVLVNVSDWAIGVTANLDHDQWQRMLACEHGGMNEVLADVYAITGETKYLDLAEKFYHEAILEPLAAGRSPLPGIHANTQVPKIIGCARLYELTGNPKYRRIATFFWDRVVNHHSYVNGGNSAWEHFGEPDQLAERLGDTTETCNTYNMLKLTRHLFSWEPRAAYMDFYERALLNHIAASINPDTGMTKYKGYLDKPARKHFATPHDSFWCCTGTGMENHVKYNDSVFYRGSGTLWVNLYVPARLDWAQQEVVVEQATRWPYEDASRLAFSTARPVEFTLRLRRPGWATGEFAVLVNGEPASSSVEPGSWLALTRTFADGDVVEVRMERRLRIEAMPDDAGRIAFFQGPVLMCAEVGEDRAVPVLVGAQDEVLGSFTVGSAPLEFAAAGAGRVLRPGGIDAVDVKLVPHFEVHEGWFSVFLDQFTPAAWEAKRLEYEAELARQRELEARTVDRLRVGEMQPERDHDFEGEQISTGEFGGRRWRHAVNGGWFAFDLKVDPQGANVLACDYWGDDAGGRVFDILVDGQKIATQRLERERPGEFFTAEYPVPVELTRGKETVRVRFQAQPGRIAGGLYGVRMLRE